MGQRSKILTELMGFQGWVGQDWYWASADGVRLLLLGDWSLPPRGATLVIDIRRRWAPRCADCGAICDRYQQKTGKARRWRDLECLGHPVVLEYAPQRVRCRRCGGTGVELLPWADKKQRQTKRLQQQVALESASMPTMHVAALHGLDWKTVRAAEMCALERWDRPREHRVPRQVGIDEKYLGRRGKRDEDFVTIISDVETGEPIWIGYGRAETTVAAWFATLKPEEKEGIQLFVMDMHRAFWNAVRNDPVVGTRPIVHDPFHVMKRAVEAVDEVRRAAFFRAGPEQRAIGRGTRWLVLRAWEKNSPEQQAQLKEILRLNRQLARAYQIAEELREALRAPDRETMNVALEHILRRTERRDNKPLRKLHDSLQAHREELLALAEHRPAAGRVEALNNNWESLVRRGRGYRDLNYLLIKLRFMTVYPISNEHGVARFLALGLPPPARAKEAA